MLAEADAIRDEVAELAGLRRGRVRLESGGEAERDGVEAGEGAESRSGSAAHGRVVDGGADADDREGERRHLGGVDPRERSGGAGEADAREDVGETGVSRQGLGRLGEIGDDEHCGIGSASGKLIGGVREHGKRHGLHPRISAPGSSARPAGCVRSQRDRSEPGSGCGS